MITGLVTFIATYHYFRIFNSWNDAFNVVYDAKLKNYAVTLTGAPFNDAFNVVYDAKLKNYALTLPGAPFNDAYRYVDW